jgi:hypothetical protein
MMVSNHVNGKTTVLVKQRVKTNIRLAAAFAAIIALFAGQHAFAADATNNANTLKVSPVRTDVQIPAGTSQTVKVTVTNITGASITVTPIENDFVAGDEKGTPALILDQNAYAPTHSLKRFMRPLPNITIPSKQGRTIDVVIVVPKDAQPGGYFGAIRFAPTDTSGGGTVNLSASVASIILMRVPGPTTEKLTLTNFDIEQDGKSGSSFRTSDNLQLALRFKNDGNLQEGPFGNISVKNGDKIVYSNDFNGKDPRDMVLPDSARKWTVPLKNIGTFGHYTLIGTFTYGEDNQTIQVTKTFWIIPWAIIIGGIVGIIVLILLIVGIVVFLRGYKKRILKKQNSRRR